MIHKNDSSKDFTRQLIELCFKNDRRAQIQLYNNYSKAMYNVCLNIVHHPATAEDLMQEAFISAFKNLKSFKGEVSFGAWLKKITINKCIDFLKQRRINFDDMDTSINVADITEEDDYCIYEQRIEEIKKTIAEMPVGFKTILSLYLFEGLDHDEISQYLGITASTSRSQFARAKALLVKQLKGR